VEHLRSKGVRVMAGPISIDSGPVAGLRVNYFLDPWGTQLELVEFKD
jgi:glyoxylase I family protein